MVVFYFGVISYQGYTASSGFLRIQLISFLQFRLVDEISFGYGPGTTGSLNQ